MADTRETLERIRDLLSEDPPQNQQALRLVKDLLIQGICARELDRLRHASVLLLERLVQPVLAGDLEHKARISRLVRKIRSGQVLDSRAISAHLEEIKPWMEGQKARVQSADSSTPNFPAQLVQASLITLGGNELKEVFSLDKEPSWEEMYLQLGSIIHRQRRSRSNWQREHRELQSLLAETTRTLLEAMGILGIEDNELEQLAERLVASEPIIDYVAVREQLVVSVQRFQDRSQEIRQRLRESRESEDHFRVLLHRAEWELLDVRDEKLVDFVTGLPNRFALVAYLERAMQFHHDGAPGFTVIFLRIGGYAESVADLGRPMVKQLMKSLTGRVTSVIRPRDYLARYNDETWAVVCPGTGESESVALATHLRELLDFTRFEIEKKVVTLKVALGVVRHERGESTESLMGLGLMAAKEALELDILRVQSVPPRQKAQPEVSSRKKLFG